MKENWRDFVKSISGSELEEFVELLSKKKVFTYDMLKRMIFVI